MSLDRFIATLRADRESRSGPGLYASDKVFALLDELDAKDAALKAVEPLLGKPRTTLEPRT